jgi:hypothetical protein
MPEGFVTAYYSRPARRYVGALLGGLAVLHAATVVAAWLVSPVAGMVLVVVGVSSMSWLSPGLLRMGAYVHDDHLLVRSNMGRARRLL